MLFYCFCYAITIERLPHSNVMILKYIVNYLATPMVHIQKSVTLQYNIIDSMDIKELYDLYLQHPCITTDSRNCPKDSIFLALKGASFRW